MLKQVFDKVKKLISTYVSFDSPWNSNDIPKPAAKIIFTTALTCNYDQCGTTQKLCRNLGLYSAVCIMVYQRQVLLDKFEGARAGGVGLRVIMGDLDLFLRHRTLPETTIVNAGL